MLFASMYEKPTGRISENTLSGRKNKIMNKVEKNKKKRHIHRILLLTGVLPVIVINAAAWAAPWISEKAGWGNWCDWYAEYVNPVIVAIFARFGNLFSFSLGEVMIVTAILLILAFLILNILLIFLRKHKKYRRFCRIYDLVVAYITVVVCLIMTGNCTIYYHCSAISVNGETEERQYKVEELQALRNYIVKQCNEYSTKVERDENGHITYDGHMQEQARNALRKLSGRYPRLSGYYPNVKHMMFSGLMSQSYMAGYYFPFSMEANCNANMYITNYPATYCHELAHLHGYIYEDEANFISYLACIGSEDPFFIYSGYLSVLSYVDNAYYEAIGEDAELYLANERISEQVLSDDIFLLPETWEKVEDKAILSTDTVNQASNTFTETSLNLNGVSDGFAAYDRVTGLLLRYYDEELY